MVANQVKNSAWNTTQLEVFELQTNYSPLSLQQEGGI